MIVKTVGPTYSKFEHLYSYDSMARAADEIDADVNI